MFFFPYVTAGVSENRFENDEGTLTSESSLTYAGGMDVKYGINDAFTLDMTLVPDFSQVQSDNQVLNVTPFEIRFQENRAFFTEGTELFNKGRVFYSRRIGASPKFIGDLYDIMADDDTLVDAPGTSQLINATKVSGRTDKGLGIGVFNAVTSETIGKYWRASDDTEHEVVIDPLTNFNLVVFDQNLKNNSYASITNTNVMRAGEFYDANVTATEFELRNKENSYSVSGRGAVSYRPGADDGEENGHAFSLSLGKISGNFNWEAGYGQESDTYNPNDLGLLFNNNSHDLWGYMGYFIYEPFGKFNRLWSNFNVGRSFLFSNGAFTENSLNINGGLATRKFFAFGGNFYTSLTERYDYFEPREDGRVYVYPRQIYANSWFSSDYSKIFALDGDIGYSNFKGQDRPRFEWSLSPRVRVNDKFNFNYSLGGFYAWNDEGYAGHPEDYEDLLLFGIRDRIRYTQTFRANYVFTPFMSVYARLRHFWSGVDVFEVRDLGQDGDLLVVDGDSGYTFDPNEYDRNVDGFTADVGLRWVFKPGSELSLVYRLIADDSDNIVTDDLMTSLNDSFRGTRDQVITLRVLYFIDALQFRGIRKSQNL